MSLVTEDESTATPTGLSRKRLWFMAALAAAVLVGVVASGVAAFAPNSSKRVAVAAAKPGVSPFGRGLRGGRGARGTIASLTKTGFTVKDTSGATTKVLTSSATTYIKTSTGAVNDITTGDNVMVLGGTADAGITADRIIDTASSSAAAGIGRASGGPGGLGSRGPGAAVRGVVASVDGAAITVTLPDGSTSTVTTTSSTVVTLIRPVKFADLKTGDAVQVVGTTASDGTVTASMVRDGMIGGGGRGGIGRGVGPSPGGAPDGAPDGAPAADAQQT